jgi:hypothetical protein
MLCQSRGGLRAIHRRKQKYSIRELDTQNLGVWWPWVWGYKYQSSFKLLHFGRVLDSRGDS